MATQLMTVNVLNVNELAAFVLLDTNDDVVTSLTFSLAGVENGDAVGRVVVADPDAGKLGQVNFVQLARPYHIDDAGYSRIADKTKLKSGSLVFAVPDGSCKPLTSKSAKYTIDVTNI